MKIVLSFIVLVLVALPAFAMEKHTLIKDATQTGQGKVFSGLKIGHYTMTCVSAFGSEALVVLELEKEGEWKKATEVRLSGSPSYNGVNFFVNADYKNYRAFVASIEGEAISCFLEPR